MPAPRLHPGRICTLLPALAAAWLTLSHTGAGPRRTAAPKTGPFKVPPGFVVEKVAGPPVVERPMMACFDEQGRLFVAESAGKNWPFPQLAKDPPNFIRLLQPAGPGGRFTKSSVFADKMTFPMGVLWHDGALYAASAPSFWRLQDTRGKGVADRRTPLATGFSSVGNGADIHGPFLGPDGRLYWTKGRHAHHVKLPGGKVLKGLAARVFRCQPDGSNLEEVCGGGMDDPVEIAFTAEGEPLVTVDILEGSPRRIDALIYAVEGGVYPYHASYREFKSTGDLLPPVADLGWVAPSGLVRYRGEAFGKGYHGNLFSAQFNRRRVQRHVLRRDGASFRVTTEDFLVSTDPDFHPTDVLEDADGSLLVIDTGGWFRIGCPSSRIAKPQVKGAIYRVGRKDATSAADPRGLILAWDQLTPRDLAKLLDDPRFTVRDRAVHLLGRKKAVGLGKLLGRRPSVRARRNAVWALCRMNSARARGEVRRALEDQDLSVRLSAAHAVALHRDAAAGERLRELVAAAEEHPAVRREAATALGRIGDGRAVPSLFEGLRLGGDRFLEHALLYALIRIHDRGRTLKGLRDPSPVIRRAALIALDQMDNGKLTRDLVTPLLNTDDPALQRAALGVITSRPGWAKEITGLLGKWLARDKLDAGRKESVRGGLRAFAKDKAVQDLVAEALKQKETPVATRLLLLEVIAQSPLDKSPPAWVRALGDHLGHPDARVVRQAVAAVRATGAADFDPSLLALARDGKRPADLRVAALAAAGPRLKRLGSEDFAFLTGRLGKEIAPLSRLAAAEVLGDSRLGERQLLRLTRHIARAGALELPHLLAAYEHSTSGKVGTKLVAALAHAPGLTGLTAEGVRRTLLAFPSGVRARAKPLLKRLAVDAEKQKARLVELKGVLTGGDSRRGRAVFFGTKAACSACHTVQGQGGRVGPDLSKIGAIRSGPDLLESVVFPSASFARGYEPYLIQTRAGKQFTGIIARDTADAVYLRTAERAEIRVARGEIESISRGRVSIMPQGLDAQLSRRELTDLMAFLKSLK
jgi:putative membrane-bound dehydrogenase-like protein